MPEGKWKRGEPRKVHVDGEREGNNLDDVLRDILAQLIDERGWPEAEVGKRIGVSQSTINRFRNCKSEGKIDLISCLCAALDNSPLQLFARHPLYEEEGRQHVRFPKDHLYDRYNTLLRNAEARDLISALEQARELGVLDEALQAIHPVLDAARKRSAIRRPTPRPRRKRAPSAGG
jgi:transcriptional regulator with XRE-family HTH domain